MAAPDKVQRRMDGFYAMDPVRSTGPRAGHRVAGLPAGRTGDRTSVREAAIAQERDRMPRRFGREQQAA
ncbi:MAG TPA: hypothetical protein VGD21_07575, partial [Lysobacter sp.]